MEDKKGESFAEWAALVGTGTFNDVGHYSSPPSQPVQKLGPVDWTFGGRFNRAERRAWSRLPIEARRAYCYKMIASGLPDVPTRLDEYAHQMVLQQARDLLILRAERKNGPAALFPKGDPAVRDIQRRYNLIEPPSTQVPEN